MDSARIRRWQRIAQLAIDSAELVQLRAAIVAICIAPEDLALREHLRALADAGELYAQLVPLLAVEGRGVRDRPVMEALRDEANAACAHVERPRDRLSGLEARVRREPDRIDHREHLAWVYYLVGAWAQAAHELEVLLQYAPEDDRLLLLRAAGRLYRNSGRTAAAMGCYRAIAIRKPGDIDALLAIGELLAAPPATSPSPFDPGTQPATPAPVEATPAPAPPSNTPRAARAESAKPVVSPAPRVDTAFVAPWPVRVDAQTVAALDEPVEAPTETVLEVAEPPPPAAPSQPVAEHSGPRPSLFATLDDAELDASIDHALGIEPAPTPVAELLQTSIELDSIPDAVNTGEHEVPNLDFEDDDIPVHLRRQR